MKIYVGSKEKANPTIFESEKEPRKETHPQYNIIFGPFKNREIRCRYGSRGCLQRRLV
jgi:hypothetical protein